MKICFTIDITKDPLYIEGFKKGYIKGFKKGYERGLNKARIKRVEPFIIHTEFDDAYIALLMAVPLELVQQTRQKLATKKPENGH